MTRARHRPRCPGRRVDGLLIGVLLGSFAPVTAWIPLLLGSIAFGALWGAIFGLVRHASFGGRRDFTSERALLAERYDVRVDAPFAPQARRTINLDPDLR